MSKETRWTPGPWFACKPEGLGMTVARVDGLWSVKCDEPVASGEYDARLIAAAPELYEVLDCIDFDDGMIAEALGENIQDKIIAALAKARGEL